MDMIYLLTRKCLIICILVLHLNSVSVMSNTLNCTILGLFPINSTSAKEAADLVWATNNLKEQYFVKNASVDIQVYNKSNQDGMAMKIMLETFAQPNKLTAIIGPGSKKAIHNLAQFLDTIPEKVLHLVYNPVINSKDYLHNTAPSVSLVVDLLIDLMVKIKWNYIAILRDSTEFSRLSCDLFQEKARRNRICIGLVRESDLNEGNILDEIESAGIKGILVFGKEDTVRSVSRTKMQRYFRFIFASNENLHTENTKVELPDLSIQVMWSGFYNQTTSNDHLKYINDSVRMALTWFNICQNLSNCRDLQQQEIINGTLDIYQKVQNKQFKVGIFEKELILNSFGIRTEESFCKKKCEKCHMLDTIPNSYIIKSGAHYIILLLPLHESDINNHFMCSQSLHLLESVDLVEAARFAIKTSVNPNLGLIIVDSCIQPLVTTEQLIGINYTNVLGVVGGFFSLTTIPAAEVLTRLQIPQISYGAESHVLSDRGRFPYFQRTITSVEEKSKAIILLCKRMGWKAINIMYTKEPYGISGRSLLVKYAKIYGICIVNDIEVELGEEKFQMNLNQLRETSKVKVIVTFMLQQSQIKWLSVLNEDLEDNEFFFIEAYGLGDPEVQKILKNHFNTQVIVEVNKPTNREFLDYYTNLTKSDIEKNPWAKEFIEDNNECRFEGSFNTAFDKECKYKLQVDSVSRYHDLVIKAIYALINGTDRAFNKFSRLNNEIAQKISEEIRKTRLNISGKEQRLFDDDGNSQIQIYSLMRVKKVDPSIEYEKFATYEDGTWKINGWDEFSSFTSTCNPDDSCTVCSEKNEIVFIAFIIMDVILAVTILTIIGVFIWKKRGVCGKINF